MFTRDQEQTARGERGPQVVPFPYRFVEVWLGRDVPPSPYRVPQEVGGWWVESVPRGERAYPVALPPPDDTTLTLGRVVLGGDKPFLVVDLCPVLPDDVTEALERPQGALAGVRLLHQPMLEPDVPGGEPVPGVWCALELRNVIWRLRRYANGNGLYLGAHLGAPALGLPHAAQPVPSVMPAGWRP